MLHLSPSLQPIRCCMLPLTSDVRGSPGKDKPCEIVEGIRGYRGRREGERSEKDFTSRKLYIYIYMGSCLEKKKNREDSWAKKIEK